MVGVIGGVRVRFWARICKSLGSGSGRSSSAIGVVATFSWRTGEVVGCLAKAIDVTDRAGDGSARGSRRCPNGRG